MIHNCRDFGLVVRDIRVGRSLTQAEVAERAGVSRVWLSQFENGKQTVELAKVLSVLDVLGYGLDVRRSNRGGSERFRRAFAALDPAARSEGSDHPPEAAPPSIAGP